MHCSWYRSTFLRALIFLQIKDGGSNLWLEPILQNVWIIWSSLLYFNSKSFMEPNSLSLIRFLCIVYDTGVLLKEPWSFYKLKWGGPNLWGEPILQNVWIIWFPLLYFNFKSFMDPNFSSLIRFQCIVHDSGVLFSESWNFYILKSGT